MILTLKANINQKLNKLQIIPRPDPATDVHKIINYALTAICAALAN